MLFFRYFDDSDTASGQCSLYSPQRYTHIKQAGDK